MSPVKTARAFRAACRTSGALLAAACAVSTSLFGSPALAQPAPAAPPAAPPPAAAPAAPPAGQARADAGQLGPGEDANKERPDRLKEALAPRSGGLTPQVVAAMAVQHSPSVAVADANRDAASGQVISTVVQYVPKVTLTASYTRISETDPVSLGGGRSLVAIGPGGPTGQPSGQLGVGPCPQDPTQQCVVDETGATVASVEVPGLAIPQNLNQYLLNANFSVPISDYFLRAVQSYQAASGAEDALEFQAQAQRLQAASDAKLALYNWIQTKGQTAVTVMSVEQAQAQVDDAKVGLNAGSLSRADLLRVEAQLAQAQFTEAEARAQESTAAERLRTLTGMPTNRPMEVGVDVFVAPSVPNAESVDALIAEASKNRLDLDAARAQEEARDDAENVTSAAYVPRVDGVANLTYANPNQRVFLGGDEWNGTWDIGVRATWVINDTFSTIGAARAARAQTVAATAQRRALEDAVRIEVVAARADIQKSGPSLEAATRGLVAAEESYRVTKQLFAYGKATAVSLTDAEVTLTNARLRKLAAHVNLLAATVRLDHATGRDRVREAR